MGDAAAARGPANSEAMEIGSDLHHANGDLPGLLDTPSWERTNPASSDSTLAAMDAVTAHSGHAGGGTAPMDSSPSPKMAGSTQEHDVRRSTETGCAIAAIDGSASGALNSAAKPALSGGPARDGGSPGGGSSGSDACEFPRLSEKATAMTPISRPKLQEATTAGVDECGDTVQGNGVHSGVNGTKGRNSSALKLKKARAGITTVMELASAVAEAMRTHASSSSNILSGGAVECMDCDADMSATSSIAACALDAPGSASPPKHVAASTAKEAVAVAALVTELLGALDASVAVVLRALDSMPHVQFYEVCESARREARTAQAVLIFARSHDAATASTPRVLQTAKEKVLADPLPKSASRKCRGMKQVAADVRDAVAAASSALDPYIQGGNIGLAGSVPMAAQDASVAEPVHADPVPDGESATEVLAQSRTEILKSLMLAAEVANTSLFDAPGGASSRLPPVVIDTDRARRARSVAEHVTQLMEVLDASTTLALRCLRDHWAPDRTRDALQRTMQDACMAQALLESVKDGAAVDDQGALMAAKAKATAIHVTLDVAQDVEKLPAMIKSATVAAVTALNEYLKTDSGAQFVPESSPRQRVPEAKAWAKKASDSKAAETLDSVPTVRRLDVARKCILEALRLAEAVSRNQTTVFTLVSSEGEHKPMEQLVEAAERARDVAALVTHLLQGLDVRIGVAVRSIEEEWAPSSIKEVFQSTRQDACTAQALLESVENGAPVDDRAARRAAETKGAMLAPFPPHAWGTKKLVDRIESVAATAVAVLNAVVKPSSYAKPASYAKTAPSAIARSGPWVKKASNSKAAETLDSSRAEDALEKARQDVLRSLQFAADVAEERLATASAERSDAHGPESVERLADQRARAVASLVTQLLKPVDMWVAEALKSVQEEQVPLRIKECFHSTRQKAWTAQALLESVRDGAAVDDEEALKAAIAKGTNLAPPPPHAWGTKKLVEKVESAAAVAMVVLKPHAKSASYAKPVAYVKARALPASSSASAPSHWLKKASNSKAAETLDSARAEEKLNNARQDILESFKLAEAVAEMLLATTSGRKSVDGEPEPVEHPTGDPQRARAVAALVMKLLEPLSMWVTESLKSVQEERPPAHIKRVFHSTRQNACTAQALLESVRDGSAVDDEEALKTANAKGTKLPPPPPQAWGLRKLVEKVESVSAAANAALGPYVTTEVKNRAMTETPRASTSSVTVVAPASASVTAETEGTDGDETVYSELEVKRLEGAREDIMESLRLASAFAGKDISAAAAPDFDGGGGGGGSANVEQQVGTVERPRAVAALVVKLMGELQKAMSLAIWSVQQQWVPSRMKDVLHNTWQKAYTAQQLLESVASGVAIGDEAIAAAKAKGAALVLSPGSTLGSETLVKMATNAAAAAKYAMRTATTIPAGGAATAEAPSKVSAVAPIFTTVLMATVMPGERSSATHPDADLDAASIPRLPISSPTVSGQAADEESRTGLSQPPPHKKSKTAGKRNTLECTASASGKQALSAPVTSATHGNQSAPHSTVARAAFKSTASPSPHN